MKSLRILNSAYHQLHIVTYDQLLIRAKQLLGITEQKMMRISGICRFNKTHIDSKKDHIKGLKPMIWPFL